MVYFLFILDFLVTSVVSPKIFFNSNSIGKVSFETKHRNTQTANCQLLFKKKKSVLDPRPIHLPLPWDFAVSANYFSGVLLLIDLSNSQFH